jgi:hypothetical protein
MLLTENELEVAASVAGEDLRRGDFVAVLSVIHEYPSFFWCDSAALPRDEPVRIQYAVLGDCRLLKVKALCLPFVFAKEPAGAYRTLDLRFCRLARLAPKYARRVWRSLRRKKAPGTAE